jgi:hypothetical protein
MRIILFLIILLFNTSCLLRARYHKLTTNDFKKEYRYDLSLRKRIIENQFIVGKTTIEDVEKVFGKDKEDEIFTYGIPYRMRYNGKMYYFDKEVMYRYSLTRIEIYPGVTDYSLKNSTIAFFYYYQNKLVLNFVTDHYEDRISGEWKDGDLHSKVELKEEDNETDICTLNFYRAYTFGNKNEIDTKSDSCEFYKPEKYFNDPFYNGMRIPGLGYVRCDSNKSCTYEKTFWTNFLDFWLWEKYGIIKWII